MTLLDTIRLIESAAAAQPSVKMIVRQDARRLNDCADALYGAFAWVQGQHTSVAGSGIVSYNLTLFYIDRLTFDKSNETQIQSVGVSTLGNILRTVADSDSVVGVGDTVYTPFDYRFADECAGVYCTVRVDVPEDSVCGEDYDYSEEIKII